MNLSSGTRRTETRYTNTKYTNTKYTNTKYKIHKYKIHKYKIHKYKIHKYNAIWNSSSEDKNNGAVGSGFKTWMWGETNVKGLLNHIFTQCLAKIWKYLEIVSLLIFYDISMNEVTVQHVEFYIVMNFMLFSQLYWQLGWVLYFSLYQFHFDFFGIKE